MILLHLPLPTRIASLVLALLSLLPQEFVYVLLLRHGFGMVWRPFVALHTGDLWVQRGATLRVLVHVGMRSDASLAPKRGLPCFRRRRRSEGEVTVEELRFPTSRLAKRSAARDPGPSYPCPRVGISVRASRTQNFDASDGMRATGQKQRCTRDLWRGEITNSKWLNL